MDVASLVTTLYGGPPPFRVEAYDGSAAQASTTTSNPVTIKILRREALTRFVTHPGELGLARAYIAGDLDVDGDLDQLFSLRAPSLRALARPTFVREVTALLGRDGLRPLPAPSIETRPRGALHSQSRDRDAVTHHYDVSNRFYEMVLGPSMTYSCAVFRDNDDFLEAAQTRKVDLVARKLGLAEGFRLLDVGCGWGTMAIHAASNYGARAIGITLSEPQARYATERARREGVGNLVEFRVQDYRDVVDEPFDAVSSIGMSEHVGRRALDDYADQLFGLVRPGGRLLNHAIGRPVVTDEHPRPTRARESWRLAQIAMGLRGPSRIYSPFIERYVFPDGELHEVGTMVTLFQAHGFEVRHVEGLREHYVMTLRHWVDNLAKRWDEAIAEVGEARARVWRLYMSGSAAGFERHHLDIHQVLCVRPDGGRSELPLRPDFEPMA